MAVLLIQYTNLLFSSLAERIIFILQVDKNDDLSIYLYDFFACYKVIVFGALDSIKFSGSVINRWSKLVKFNLAMNITYEFIIVNFTTSNVIYIFYTFLNDK